VEISTKKKDESEASPGALFSSGLIAAGGVFGLLGIIINLFQDKEISSRVPAWVVTAFRLPWREDLFSFGPKLMGHLATSSLFAMVMFGLLSGSLFYFARKKLD
jgi:membrane associated rhomboid family serine protease